MPERQNISLSHGKLAKLLEDVDAGHRLSTVEALSLFEVKGREIWDIAKVADMIREKETGNNVTYVKNQNINVTNCCINSCGFCGYSRKPGDSDVYYYTKEQIQEKVLEAVERNVTEICTVSGLHPDFNADSYTDIISWIHEAAPNVHIHASNPMEVAYGAKKSGVSTREMLTRMRESGLGSLCGTAAEILDDGIRKIICPGKVTTFEWKSIIKEAHEMGIPSTATIMYGHVDKPKHILAHLNIIREIQDDTRGFTEFVPLSFVHYNAPIYLNGIARAGATGREDILMYAISRLFLDNIRNIQVSWVKLGRKMAQLGLISGANDMGGTMYEESISKGAGAKDTDYMDPYDMQIIAEDIGRDLKQRNTLYDLMN